MIAHPRVVIIDPDEKSRAEFERTLSLAQFQVVGGAGYGTEGLSLASEKRPDLILLSMEEPVTRPVQTLEALSMALPDAPIVVYSSLQDREHIRRAVVAGARDYLDRKVKPEEMNVALRDLLNAEQRRRQRRESDETGVPVLGTVITVFGAKGGIGKTTIATNLAVALRKVTNGSVVIADLDTRFGDVALTMNLEEVDTLAEAVARGEELNRDTLRGYLTAHRSGVEVLPAPGDPSRWTNITASHVEQVVRMLAETHDYVVLDTPGTFNEIVAKAVGMANLLLVVTSTEVTSIKDTVLAVRMLERQQYPSERIKLAVNHANRANSVTSEDVRRLLGREIFWEIPHDQEVSLATQLGSLVVEMERKSRAAGDIASMASAISGVRAQSGRSGGLVRRVFGRSA